VRRFSWQMALASAGAVVALGAGSALWVAGATPNAQPTASANAVEVGSSGGSQAAGFSTLGSTTATTLSSGAFVIGDQNAAVGSQVTFWGAQWWTSNTLSGGQAPASFKGFAANAANPPTCGSSWSTAPGNSSNPPATIPQFMEVIVSTTVSKSGPSITGDTAEVVLVETNPGYAGDPGHPGTGTVVSVICGGPSTTGGGGGVVVGGGGGSGS
jgi:hypothetical protein